MYLIVLTESQTESQWKYSKLSELKALKSTGRGFPLGWFCDFRRPTPSNFLGSPSASLPFP
jgi:hypothetical protein